jgi:hypothetical protein
MAKQMKQENSFLGKLEDFLLRDDQARWKAIGWIIAVTGVLGSVDLVFLNSSVDETVQLMGFLVSLMSILWISWYCSFKQRLPALTETYFWTRRELVLQAACLVAFVSTLGIPVAEAREADLKLRTASENPKSTKSILDAATTFITARAANLKLSRAVVRETTDRFITVSQEVPSAWDVALEAASYSSNQLNPLLLPPLGALRKLNPNELGSRVWLRYPDGAQVWAAGKVSPNDSAGIESLDTPFPFDWDVRYLIVDWNYIQTLEIDGGHLKHIILKNATVRYSGGPLWLEDVYFVNCNFAFLAPGTATARLFMRQILKDASVTFRHDWKR